MSRNLLLIYKSELRKNHWPENTCFITQSEILSLTKNYFEMLMSTIVWVFSIHLRVLSLLMLLLLLLLLLKLRHCSTKGTFDGNHCSWTIQIDFAFLSFQMSIKKWFWSVCVNATTVWSITQDMPLIDFRTIQKSILSNFSSLNGHFFSLFSLFVL